MLWSRPLVSSSTAIFWDMRYAIASDRWTTVLLMTLRSRLSVRWLSKETFLRSSSTRRLKHLEISLMKTLYNFLRLTETPVVSLKRWSSKLANSPRTLSLGTRLPMKEQRKESTYRSSELSQTTQHLPSIIKMKTTAMCLYWLKYCLIRRTAACLTDTGLCLLLERLTLKRRVWPSARHSLKKILKHAAPSWSMRLPLSSHRWIKSSTSRCPSLWECARTPAKLL